MAIHNGQFPVTGTVDSYCLPHPEARTGQPMLKLHLPAQTGGPGLQVHYGVPRVLRAVAKTLRRGQQVTVTGHFRMAFYGGQPVGILQADDIRSEDEVQAAAA